MAFQPVRPWTQEPEAPDVPKLSVHAQALRRRAMSTVPERAASLTPDDWETQARYYLERGAYEHFEYGPDEAERLVRAEESEASVGLRRNHLEDILMLQASETGAMGFSKDLRNWVQFKTAEKIGYKWDKALPEIKLGEAEQKVANAYFANWEENHLEQWLKSPSMVTSILEKEETSQAIADTRALGGDDALAVTLQLAQQAGDEFLAREVANYQNRMQASELARGWMVASGRSAGDEENIGSMYSTFLGARAFAEQERADPAASWKQLRAHAGMAHRIIKKTAPEYDPEFLVGNDYLRLSDVISGKRGDLEQSARILGEWLQDGNTDALFRGAISGAEAEAGMQLFAAKPEAARALAGRHLQMVMALEERFEMSDLDVTEEDLKGYIEAALAEERTSGTWAGAALGWTVSGVLTVLGALPRGAAGFIREGKTFAPTAWVFEDGTVTQNTAVAGLQAAKRAAAGGVLEQSPTLHKAMREHANDIGAPKSALSQIAGPGGEIAFGFIGQIVDVWDGMMSGPQEGKKYALPTMVLDKTHDTGWGKLEAIRSAFDPSADYVYDVVMDINAIHKTEVGPADKAVAFGLDIMLDPLWVVGGPVARQSTKGIARLIPKLAEEAEKFRPPAVVKPHPRVPGTMPPVPALPGQGPRNLGKQVYEAVDGTDTTFARGFSSERLLDGTLMSEEMVAAHRLLGARFGGGYGGQEAARVILSKVVSDPTAMQRGLKTVMTEDGVFDQLHRHLVLAGDETFTRRAGQLRAEGEVMIAREAQERSYEGLIRAGATEAEALKASQDAALKAVQDPVKRAQLVRESGRKAAREFLDHAAPDADALVRAIPSVRRYQMPSRGAGAAEPMALEWGEYVGQKLYESGRGLHIRLGKGEAYLPISKPVRRLAQAGGKVVDKMKEARGLGMPLSATERAFAAFGKQVKKPFVWSAGIITFSHVRLPMPEAPGLLQKKAYATVKVPRHMARAYKREVAQQMAWVSERVTPMVAMELAKPIGRKLSLRERQIVSHMVEARKAYNPHTKMPNSGTVNALQGHLTDNWTREINGKIEELIPGGQPTSKEIADLAPVADQVELLIDEVLDEAAELGLLTEARDRYLPHYVAGGGQAKRLSSGRLVEGQSPTANALEGAEQLERESRMTLAQRWAKGDIIEDDIFTILSRRMMHHHEQISQLNFMGRVAEELGVPILRGERLVADIVEDMAGVAKVDQQLPWQIADEQRRYRTDMAAAAKTAKAAQGNRRRLMRIARSAGANTLDMASGRFLGKALSSDSFMAMAARGSRTVLDKVLPKTTRTELRNLARWYRDLGRKEANLRRRAGRKGLKLREVEGDLMDRIDALEEALVQRELLDEQLIKTEHLVSRETKWLTSLKSEARYLDQERKALETLRRKAEKEIANRTGRVGGVKFGRKYASKAGKKASDEEILRRRTEVSALRKEAHDLTEELTKVRKKEVEYRRLIKESEAELASLKAGAKGDRAAARGAKTAVRQAERKELTGVKRVDKLDRDLAELIQMRAAYQNWRRQLLEAPQMADVAEGFKQAARTAVRAERKLKVEIGAMADRYSIDAFDKREFLRRQNLTRAGKTPEGIAAALNKTPAGQIYGAADAVEYMKVTEQLAEAGISGELLGHLLWQQFRVTSIFHVPLQDLRLLASPKGPMVRFSGPDLTNALAQSLPKGARAAPTVGSNVAAAKAEDALSKAGIKPEGAETAQRLQSARDQLDELDALAAAGDADAMVRAARVTPATRKKLEEAEVLAFDAPPELGASYQYAVNNDIPKEDLRNLYVEIAKGKTPLAKELSNWAVPLDLAVAARALLGERVGARGAAEYLALGGWQRFAVHAGNLFKMGRTVASMTPGYGRRNQIDNYKAIVQVLGFDIYSPTFRKVYEGVLDGSLDVVKTPYGPIKASEIREAWNLLAGSQKAQLDIPNPGMAAATRRGKQGQAAYDHASASAELGARSGGSADPLPFSKEAVKDIRGKHYGAAKKGAAFGAVIGGLMGGSDLVIGGALTGATYAHTVKLAQGVGPRSTLAGAKPTVMQQVMPIGEATEVIERGFRQKALLLEVLRGRGIDDAVNRTGLLWRDWTNYTPEERYLFGHTLPVLFYNFTKQNTIAQVHRFLMNPAYLGAEARLMAMLTDATPEEYRPEWLNPATSFLRGGTAYSLSSEAFAPLELLATMASGPLDMLNPGIQKGSEALFNGLAGRSGPPVKLSQSTARALYEHGTAKYIPGFNFKIGENGVVSGELDLSNPAVAGMYLVAAATGIEAVAKYHGTLTDMWMEDRYFDLGVRALIGGQVSKTRGDVEEWLVNGSDRQSQRFAAMLDKLKWDKDANEIVARLSYEMGEEEFEVWRIIIQEDSRLRTQIGNDLHKWVKEMNGEAPSQSALPGSVGGRQE